MADHHRRTDDVLAQEKILLDNPDFLKEVVRRVCPADPPSRDDPEHIGAALTSAPRTTGQRNGYKERMLKTRVGTLELLVPKDQEGTFSTFSLATSKA